MTSSPIAEALTEVQAINRKLDDAPQPARKRTAAKKPTGKTKRSSKAASKPAAGKTKRAASKKTASPKPTRKTATPKAPRVTKQDQMIEMLSRPTGASNEELQAHFGIQRHSVRGAISGLKNKRGMTINFDKASGRYTIPA